MLVTLFGISILVRAEQPQNACSLILVTLLPKTTLAKALQLQKASSPMLVTLFGIVMLVRPLYPSNVFCFISVKPSGKTTSVTNSPFKYNLLAYNNGLEP